MDDKKMLQAIINGQSALKEELFNKINELDKKIDSAEDSLLKEIKKNSKRIDKLGYQLAELEDDALTEPVVL